MENGRTPTHSTAPRGKRGRGTAWKATVHTSEVLPILREHYKRLNREKGVTYYELAKAIGMNQVTAQRILATSPRMKCKISGNLIAHCEALARAMGGRITFIPDDKKGADHGR